MDTYSSNSDDLRKLEGRLADWKPDREALDLEAMLFAAGRASARRGRGWLAWPIACTCLALVTAVLGARLAAERSERLALIQELAYRSTGVAPTSSLIDSDKSIGQALTPNSYLVLRREWEQQLGDSTWQPKGVDETPRIPGNPQPAILRAWRPGGPVEPL
jgi:hypothetical protein